MNKIPNRLVFVDEGHKYFRVDNPDMVWTSATTVVGKYSKPFKRDEWLDYKAMARVLGDEKFEEVKTSAYDVYGGKNVFNYQATMEAGLPLVNFELWEEAREEIKEEWNEEGVISSTRGTEGHADFERKSYERGWEENFITGQEVVVPPRPDFEYDNEQIVEYLGDLPDGYYPELIVWNDESLTCGQSDGVFVRSSRGKRIATIRDYKFVKQKKMNTSHFCSIERSNLFMNPPMSHIPCSKIHGYQVQLSFYGWCLLQQGFDEIDGMWLDHINEKGRVKKIPLDFLPEVGEMVADFMSAN